MSPTSILRTIDLETSGRYKIHSGNVDPCPQVDIWTDTAMLASRLPQAVTVMVSPREEAEFVRLLETEAITHEVIIPDLEK